MIMNPAHLSSVLREWADVVDQQLVAAQANGDILTTLALVLPTERATEEDARLLQALARAASVAAAANKQLAASGTADPVSPALVLLPGAEPPSSTGVEATDQPSTTTTSPDKARPAGPDSSAAGGSGGALASGAAPEGRGFSSAVEAVVCSEDLIDHLLPFLDDFTLASIMRLNKQWKRVAARDHQWEERISSFLCNPGLDSLGHSIMLPTQLWPWYCRLQRSSKDFDARADLPVTPYHYTGMYVWLSLMINDGSQDYFGPLPLGGKVVPLGDGSVLSGGVDVVFEDTDSWALECVGDTPLASLQSYFSEESQRELLLDFWLMDGNQSRCSLVARDWGKTVVSPWSPSEEEEEEAEDEAQQAARASSEFIVKNDNDTCRVYSNGEVHVVLHSTVTLTLIESTNAPGSSSKEKAAAGEDGVATQEGAVEGGGGAMGASSGGAAASSLCVASQGEESEGHSTEDEGKGSSASSASSASSSASSSEPPLHVFRVSRVRLAMCLGLGSADRGVEEIEPEHPEELHRSVMLLAGLLHDSGGGGGGAAAAAPAAGPRA